MDLAKSNVLLYKTTDVVVRVYTLGDVKKRQGNITTVFVSYPGAAHRQLSAMAGCFW